MSIQQVREYLKNSGKDKAILEFSESSATVQQAAQAAGVIPARIAKTMSFYAANENKCILIVTAGDTKIDNCKFKSEFGIKAKMLTAEDVERLTGHAPGGVCPFANPKSAEVFLDVSLKRFETVFPAAGSSNSAIELSPEELTLLSNSKKWINVCKSKEL